MATPTIDVTVGGANSNSFGTLAEAETYFDTVRHVTDAWPVDAAASASIGTGQNGTTRTVYDVQGTDGNAYTIEVKLGLGASLAMHAELVDKVITVYLGTNGSSVADDTKNTATLIATEISLITDFTATANGTGADVIPVTASKSFTGGAGGQEVKNPALIMATQQMTALIIWTGFVADENQALPWPRNGMVARNEVKSILETEIPQEVKDAQFELARLLIASDRTVVFDVDAQGLTHLRAGPVTLKFKNSDNEGPPVIPSASWYLLVPSWFDNIIGADNVNLELARA